MNALQIVLTLAVLFGMAYWLQPTGRSNRRIYWAALVMKVSCGLLLGLLYMSYYQHGDTIAIFGDSKTLTEVAWEDAGSYVDFLWSSESSNPALSKLTVREPRTLFFTKFVSLVNLLSFNTYAITSIILSAFSFVGSWQLFKAIARFYPDSQGSAAIAFLFVPSVVFWSSGVIKESLALACLFFLAGEFVRYYNGEQENVMIRIPALLVCIWMLWNVKYFYLGVFLPIAISLLVTQQVSRFRVNPYLVFFGVFVLLLTGVSFAHPNFRIGYLPEVIADNYMAFTGKSEPGEAIIYNNLLPTWGSLLRNAPVAIYSGLFRPGLLDWRSGLQSLAIAENVLVLLLFTSSLWKLRARFPRNKWNRLLVVAVSMYILILAALLALSTPNFGTLTRFRVGYIPFFVFLILYKNQTITYIIGRLRSGTSLVSR